MRIDIEHLGKTVRSGAKDLNILADVSLSVNPGESLAVVGRSGSGKSTLLGLIAGLDTPTTGTVHLDGQDLYAMDEDGRANLRRAGMGFVFQSFQLLPGLTALENVSLPMELAGKPDADARARDHLGRVGLDDRLHHTPERLSGGEQQRVALARAFSAAPRLLLADEPTGNLDAETGARVIDLLFELNRAQGATLVVVTHDPDLAARCQRQVRLEGGRVITSF
jgi:putative ABC transport system ATP-binding protein